MTEDQLIDALKKLEPSWKTNPLNNQSQQEIFTRPPEKRVARFRFDEVMEIPVNASGGGSGPGGDGGPPPPALEAYAVSGNMNGSPFTGYLYGPPGQ